MEPQDFYVNLCTYDPRYPDYDPEWDEFRKDDCACDNCFYGRTRLAEIIIQLLKTTTTQP